MSPPPPDKPSRDEIDAALYAFVRGEPVQEQKRFSAIMGELANLRKDVATQIGELREEVRGVKARVTMLESIPMRSLSPPGGFKIPSGLRASDTGSHIIPVELEKALAAHDTAEDAETLRAIKRSAGKIGIIVIGGLVIAAITALCTIAVRDAQGYHKDGIVAPGVPAK